MGVDLSHAFFGGGVEMKDMGNAGGVDDAVNLFDEFWKSALVGQVGGGGRCSPDLDWFGRETLHNPRSDETGRARNQNPLSAHISL